MTGTETQSISVTGGTRHVFAHATACRDSAQRRPGRHGRVLGRASEWPPASTRNGIIEAHGGRLWATPNSGPGATFAFLLPLNGGIRWAEAALRIVGECHATRRPGTLGDRREVARH